MQIPSELRKCVVFLCRQTNGQIVPAGTGFFVSIPSVSPERNFVYLVTAGHVIGGIRQRGSDGLVHIRINKTDGGVEWVRVSVDQWVGHPDDSQYVDVAVFQWAPSSTVFDFLYLDEQTFVTQETVRQHEIGLGDELFMTGLFVSHYGTKRNIPIVRLGNIAAMPDEPVATREGAMTGYLVEARSIGGLSGSPVFVVIGPLRLKDGAIAVGTRTFFLLGVMRGHWEVDREARDEVVVDGLSQQEAVNMGIGIVVPMEKVREALDHPIIQANRARQNKELQDQASPTADSVPNSEDADFSQEDFERALRTIRKEPERPSPPAP